MIGLPALIVDRFQREDAMQIALRAEQAAGLSLNQRRELGFQRAEAGNSFTVREPQSLRILCCAGAVALHPGYGSLWGLYAEGLTAQQWLWLAGRTREFVHGLPFLRTDAAVDAENWRARRWARRCGLEFEGVMAAAGSHGEDIAIYRRIRT